MNKYVVYLTLYNGDKLPKWYIGSSSEKRVNNGYNGSVASKKYKEIYINEQKCNKSLFKTRILSYHKSRKDALSEELRVQKKHQVVKNDDYINMSYASINGFFGRDVSGKNHPLYGTTVSDKRKKKQIKTITKKNSEGISPTMRAAKQISELKQSKEWKETFGAAQKKKWKESYYKENNNGIAPNEMSAIKNKVTKTSNKTLPKSKIMPLYKIIDEGGNTLYECQSNNIGRIVTETGISQNVLRRSLSEDGLLFKHTRSAEITKLSEEQKQVFNTYNKCKIIKSEEVLHNIIERKFVEQTKVSKYEVLCEDGFKPITMSNKTVKYAVYEITLDDGKQIKCADTHILINRQYKEVFAKNSLHQFIRTRNGYAKVIKVENLDYNENMYDLSVDSNEHTYYTNDILSHNTVTVATYLLWQSIFRTTPINIGIVANKGSTAREVLDKIKKIFSALPIWMMQGLEAWNKGTIEYGNGTRVMAESPSGDSFRGYTINLLYEDESAYISGPLYQEYVDSVYPTMNSLIFKQVINSSTPRGMNHYYHLCMGATQNNKMEEPETTVIESKTIIEIGGNSIEMSIEELYNKFNLEAPNE